MPPPDLSPGKRRIFRMASPRRRGSNVAAATEVDDESLNLVCAGEISGDVPEKFQEKCRCEH
jgi:hypothetical protein